MQNIIYEQINLTTGLITINRTDVHNALDFTLLAELYALLDEIKSKIKVLIITGSGNKAFIAGADIKEMNNLTPAEFEEFLVLGQKITSILEESEWISIAAVNGYAFGGGTEIALACDLIYASENAKFGLPEVRLGIIPGFGGTVRLSSKLPLNKSKELIFMGQIFSAEEAFQMGLVNKITDSGNLLPFVIQEVDKMLRNSLDAVICAKVSINKSRLYNNDVNLRKEKELCCHCFTNQDRKEGMEAFIQKRQPGFINDRNKQ